MVVLPDEVIRAIGRVTIAAGELEVAGRDQRYPDTG